MNLTLSPLFILITVLLSFSSLTTYASDSIGRIVKTRGDVYKESKAGKFIKISQGEDIYEGNKISTKSGSFVKILMKDDTLFQLGPKSKFSFDEFKMKTKKDRTATYNLVQGKLRSLFTVKAKDKSLTIKTPTASMGIRGTEIVSDVYRYKGKIQTDIALLSGKLEVTTLSRKKFILKTGHMVQLAKVNKGPNALRSRKLPTRVFKSLQKSRKKGKGGKIFLLDARKSSGEIKAKDIQLTVPEAGKKIKRLQHIKKRNNIDTTKLRKTLLKNSLKKKEALKEKRKIRRKERRQRIRDQLKKKQLQNSNPADTVGTKTNTGTIGD